MMPAQRSARWGGFALNSLRIQLVLWIVLPVVVSLLGMSLVEIRGHEQAMTQMVQQQADLVARSLGVLIDAHIDQHQGALLQLANEPRAAHANGDVPTHVSTSSATANFGAGVAFLPSSPAAAALPPWTDNAAVAALVDAVQTGQVPGLATIFDPTLDQWLLVQAVPAPATEDGTVQTLVGAEVVEELLSAHLLASLDPVLLDEVRLTTAEGMVLFAQAVPASMEHTLAGEATQATRDNTQWVIAQTTVLPTGWQVTVYKDWHELVPPVLTFGNIALVIVGLAALLALLAAYFGLRNIVWPLQRLVQSAGQIGAGNFAAIQQPVGGVAEIEELRQALAHMTEQVRAYQQELQSYIGAITLGQEEERRRLARDLHDDTVQDLIALNQQVEMVARDVVRDPAQATVRLHDLRQQVNAVIDGLRRQIYALRPLYLEDLGFVPALELLLRQTGQRHDLLDDFVVIGDDNAGDGNDKARPSLAIQISAFRIAQEALQNVVKHAQATRVALHVQLTAAHLTLQIIDDGCGFDAPDRPYHLAQAGHFGLLGMKERAQLHAGTLEVRSQRGQGTTVWVRLPLHDAVDAAETSTAPTQLPQSPSH